MNSSDRFEQRFPAMTRSLSELRHGLRPWLEQAVDGPGKRSDVLLAASELAAAAVRAAPAGADGAVAVAAWVDDDGVVVESRSQLEERAYVGAPAAAFDGDDGERGFSIIAALSDVFAVKRAPSGVVVRAHMPCRFDAVRAG
jgi:anti-sigma regulatory factor (Ser/Thr protein kinase)